MGGNIFWKGLERHLPVFRWVIILVRNHQWNVRSEQIVHFVTHSSIQKQFLSLISLQHVANGHVEIGVATGPIANNIEWILKTTWLDKKLASVYLNKQILAFWMINVDAALINGNQKSVREAQVRILRNREERWSKRWPAADIIQKLYLCLVRFQVLYTCVRIADCLPPLAGWVHFQWIFGNEFLNQLRNLRQRSILIVFCDGT